MFLGWINFLLSHTRPYHLVITMLFSSKSKLKIFNFAPSMPNSVFITDSLFVVNCFTKL